MQIHAPQDREVESLKTPPFSKEAEQSVLGGLMLNNEAWISIADVVIEADFYLPEHQILYRAIKSLSEVGQPCDAVTLSEWLQRHDKLEKIGGGAYLALLANNTPSAANIENYAEIVHERSILRQLIDVGRKIMESAFNTKGQTSSQLLDNAEKLVFEIAELGAHKNTGFQDMETISSKTLDRIEYLYEQQGNITGVETGFKDFDADTLGLQASDLIIVAGRPSMGKTTFAMNIAGHVAVNQNLPVAVFSMEMSSEQLMMRLISSTAQVNLQKIRTGDLNDDDWSNLSQSLGKLRPSLLFIDDSPALSPTDLRARTRRLAREHGQLGLIVIDYLQLMQVHGSKDNRATEVSEISRSLKSLAKELNVPVIALSQLNRSLEQRPDKRPKMSDLRESGCLAGDSLVTCADTGKRVPIRDILKINEFFVWGLNTKTMQLERAKVSRAFSTGIKPVVRLQTALGRTIRATGNHKFYTPNGWKRLDELKINDYIALPRRIPKHEKITAMTDAELALLGHLIGDGCTLPTHSIQYTTREKDLAELVKQLAIDIFGNSIAPRINPERSWFQVYLKSTRKHTHGVRNPISEWLDKLGIWGLRSYDKYIPELVFQQSNDKIAIFLRHLWVTDGCIYFSPNKQHHIYYSTSSKMLAYDVQYLLIRLGINARIKRISQHNKGKDQFHVILSGKPDILSFANVIGTVGCYKTEALEKICSCYSSRVANTNRDVIPQILWLPYVQIGMKKSGITQRQLYARIKTSYAGIALFKQNISRERASRIAEAVNSKKLNQLSNSDIYWDKISAIDLVGEEEVFDLTVPSTHNFLANDIICHNSIEQDSDLIVFIYRDEVYDPESPDKGIAEIIIGKQRNGPIGMTKLSFQGQFTRFANLSKDSYYGEEVT